MAYHNIIGILMNYSETYVAVLSFCIFDPPIFLQSLDRLLVQRVSSNIGKQLTTTTGLSQAAQMITNLEHFEVACSVLERSLTSLRYVSG